MIYVLPLEHVPGRYCEQWERWFKQALKDRAVASVFIHGAVLTETVDTGTVLDAEGTNYWKFAQLSSICELFKAKAIKDGDIFFVFDMWFPGLESIRYMATLEKVNIKIYAFCHAGSYVKEDFAAPMYLWARHFEVGWVALCDKVFVGTEYHKRVLCQVLVDHPYETFVEKIIVTGNPMNTVEMWADVEEDDYKEPSLRENVVVFSHRWDPEKRPRDFIDIMNTVYIRRTDFRVVVLTGRPDSSESVWQARRDLEQYGHFPWKLYAGLTKQQYHRVLAASKVFVSTTVDEMFGYCLAEAMAFRCSPVVPNAFSHPEIVPAPECLYTPFKEDSQAVDSESYYSTSRLYHNRYTAIKDASDKVSAFLDKPKSYSVYVARYNHSFDLMLSHMGIS